jgi:hypothetical protein
MEEEGGRVADDAMKQVSDAGAEANHAAKQAVDSAKDTASQAQGGVAQVWCSNRKMMYI